jgi:hypothetical protein
MERGRTEEIRMRMPDPSTKMLRSGFGSQVRSTSPSEPSFGFGTSVRDASLRVRQQQGPAQHVPTKQHSTL